MHQVTLAISWDPSLHSVGLGSLSPAGRTPSKALESHFHSRCYRSRFRFRFVSRGEERKGETAGASVCEIRGRIETWLLAGEPGNARHRHRTFPSTFRK